MLLSFKKCITIIILLVVVLASGCANYRTNSDIDFDSTSAVDKPSLPVGNIDLKGKTIIEIGIVEVIIKKLTLFHPSPTKAQANIVLAHKAKKMGADAVIDVSYSSGIGLDTWGQIEARGTAVKIEK